MKNNVKRWQVRIFAACFLAYTAAYICRVNISVALPGIQQNLKLSSANIGLIGTAFFWVYALGQLVNGFLGDKVSSKAFIFIGLTISALINIAFGFSSLFIVMLLLWGLNGIFQSMMWGPIVKTLSNWFPGKKHDTVAFGISISLIFGYLVAWGVSGYVSERLGWRWAFWLPAIIVLALAFVWLAMAKNKPEDAGLVLAAEDSAKEKESTSPCEIEESKPANTTLWKLLISTNLILVAITGISQGAIDKSIQLWIPKLISDTQHLSLDSTVGVILIFPLINFIGVLFAGWLNRVLKFRTQLVIVLLTAGSILTSVGFIALFRVNSFVSIFFIAITSALINGANPLMTTIIPLRFKYCNKVSTVAGFMDFSMYFGAGLGGALTGILLDKFGWNTIFIVWCVILVAGTAAMGVSMVKEKNKNDNRL